MELLIALVIFAAGFFAGWFRATNSLIEKLVADPQSMILILKNFQQSLDTADKETTLREVKVEKVGDQIYLFDQETDDFLAQGPTLQDALDQVQKRFPGKKFSGHLSKEQVDSLEISVKQ